MDRDELIGKSFNFLKFRFTIKIKGCKIYKIVACEWDRYKFLEQGMWSPFNNLPYMVKCIRCCMNPIVILALFIVNLYSISNNVIIPKSSYMITNERQIYHQKEF